MDVDQLALGIQQPWIELILRGIKTIEVRNVPVVPKGPVYLYSSNRFSKYDFAREMLDEYELIQKDLARGVIVGTIDIVDCQKCCFEDVSAACVPWSFMEGRYSWKLASPRRFDEPLRPKFLPYGMWFYPFRPRDDSARAL